MIKKPKRLTVDIPEELHAEIKSSAAFRNITIRTWIIRVIVSALRKEEERVKP